jgi:hypothetical protein
MGTAVAVIDIGDVIGRAFLDLDAVEQVYVYAEGPTLRVFTIVDTDDEDVYDYIYDRERVVMRCVDAKVHFSVIDRRGRPIQEIVGDQTPIWQSTRYIASCHNAISI